MVEGKTLQVGQITVFASGPRITKSAHAINQPTNKPDVSIHVKTFSCCFADSTETLKICDDLLLLFGRKCENVPLCDGFYMMVSLGQTERSKVSPAESNMWMFFFTNHIDVISFIKAGGAGGFLLQRHRWGCEANTHTAINLSTNECNKNPKSFSVKWQNISFCASVMIITAFFTLRYIFRNFTLEPVTFSGTSHVSTTGTRV